MLYSYKNGLAKSIPTRENGGDVLALSLGKSPINCCIFLLINLLRLIQVATIFRASALTFVIQKNCLVIAIIAFVPQCANLWNLLHLFD